MKLFGWVCIADRGSARRENGKTRSDQTFHDTDGSANRAGHIGLITGGDTHITTASTLPARTGHHVEVGPGAERPPTQWKFLQEIPDNIEVPLPLSSNFMGIIDVDAVAAGRSLEARTAFL